MYEDKEELPDALIGEEFQKRGYLGFYTQHPVDKKLITTI